MLRLNSFFAAPGPRGFALRLKLTQDILHEPIPLPNGISLHQIVYQIIR
jgi:hypothetical protein